MTSGRASGVIEQYRDRLPVSEATPVVTLGEGGTPLVRSESLSAETGCEVRDRVVHPGGIDERLLHRRGHIERPHVGLPQIAHVR